MVAEDVVVREDDEVVLPDVGALPLERAGVVCVADVPLVRVDVVVRVDVPAAPVDVVVRVAPDCSTA